MTRNIDKKESDAIERKAYSAEQQAAYDSKKYRQALLLAALILLTVACAAVLTAIFARDTMPQVIEEAVKNLKSVHEWYLAVVVIACAVGGISFLGATYTGASLSGSSSVKLKNNNDESLNSDKNDTDNSPGLNYNPS